MSNRSPLAPRPQRLVAVLGALLVPLAAACTDDLVGVPSAPPSANDIVTTQVIPPTCGVGFWKNHSDPATWDPTGYAPALAVSQVFDGAGPYAGHTLLATLGLGGGPGVNGAREILLRAAVAALLNAAHPDIDSGMTAADLIDMVNVALAEEQRHDMLSLADALDQANDGSCVLAPGGPEDPGLPDLIVSQIVFGIATESSLPRTATIQNVGTAPVDVMNVGVQGYYSVDTVLDLGVDAAACGRVISTTSLVLDPGETVNVTSNCSFPDPQYEYLLIRVDHGGAIAESDESNNVSAIALPEGG